MLAFTTHRPQTAPDALETARYVSVTTYRRDGRAVSTPVEFIEKDGSLFFRTLPDSGKVKRIRRQAGVLVASCTMRGKLTGPKQPGIASLLSADESEELWPAFHAKYGWLWSVLIKLRRPRSQGVRIDLT